ncbi:MAG: nuclear transport factor 2 family protein [Myxococcota bacterium]
MTAENPVTAQNPMTAQKIADAYYANFTAKSDFQDVPMSEKLHFQSPMMALDGPEAFRGALTGLLARFQGLDIRHQHASSDTVVTVYDFDLGLPDGPVPMAEVLTVEHDALSRVELIFDAKRLAPPA